MSPESSCEKDVYLFRFATDADSGHRELCLLLLYVEQPTETIVIRDLTQPGYRTANILLDCLGVIARTGTTPVVGVQQTVLIP